MTDGEEILLLKEILCEFISPDDEDFISQYLFVNDSNINRLIKLFKSTKDFKIKNILIRAFRSNDESISKETKDLIFLEMLDVLENINNYDDENFKNNLLEYFCFKKDIFLDENITNKIIDLFITVIEKEEISCSIISIIYYFLNYNLNNKILNQQNILKLCKKISTSKKYKFCIKILSNMLSINSHCEDIL